LQEATCRKRGSGHITIKEKQVDCVGNKDEKAKTKVAQEAEFSQKAERELKLFSAAVKMSLDGIVIGDLNGYITEVNDAIVKMYRAAEKSEFVGKHVLEFLVESDRECALRDSLDSILLGQGRTSEYRALSKSGEEVPVEVTVAFIRDENGENIGFVDIIRNLSNRKKNEEELKNSNRKMELMNEKLRVIGGLTRHDILNKLQIIDSNLFLLKKNRGYTQAFEAIENTSKQIRSILDFSRDFEMLGAEELKYIDVDWALREAVSLASDMKGVCVLNDCLGLSVLADSLLREIFHNLIDNTLKYGEKTTQIQVSYEDMGGQLKLVFEDDGVGIPSEMKQKLFTRGFGKGTGLGLFLIKKAVDFYGWQVQEAGTEGKGAKFMITIPKTNANGKDNYHIRKS
jgi:PAS domain S-box-containing protein